MVQTDCSLDLPGWGDKRAEGRCPAACGADRSWDAGASGSVSGGQGSWCRCQVFSIVAAVCTCDASLCSPSSAGEPGISAPWNGRVCSVIWCTVVCTMIY